MKPDRVRAAALVVLATMLAACGRESGDFQVGIKRVALALAFAEEDLAEPVEPSVIRRLAPTPPELDLRSPPATDAVDFGIESPLACPTMPPGASPREPVARTVARPPAIGSYPRHNEGKVEVTLGTVPLTLPFPPFTTWEVPEVNSVPRPTGPLSGTPADTTPPGSDYEIDVRKQLVAGAYEVTDRLLITHADIKLLQRTTLADGETTTFTPDPPIVVYQYGVEGTVWRSAGVDTETDTAMLFEGTIEQREVVDVCGEPIDTYRVRATETVVNLETGETSGTDPEDPNVYNVAPHHGGLVVREDVHSTTRARDAETGAPVTVVFDYVSTASTVEPVAP